MNTAMEHDPLSRRALLQGIAATFGAAALPWDWGAIEQAVHQAHAAAPSSGDGAISFLTPAEAADVDAIAAQIIPTDDTPGAREAGVVLFHRPGARDLLRRACAGDFRAQLAGFQAALPGAASGRRVVRRRSRPRSRSSS